jgi:hypothetical protein
VFLAGLLHQLPRDKLRHLLLLVPPDTVLRWHRDLIKRHHATTCAPRRRGRQPTVRSIRTLILRLARENSSWGTAESTASSRPWASRSPPRPSGRSCGSTASRPHPNERAPHGLTSCATRRTPCGMRFLRNPQADRDAPVRLRGDRARHPADPDPGCHRTPHCGLGGTARAQSCHGPAGHRHQGPVPDPRP